MKIVQFDEKYADEMARLYVDAYSESGDGVWSVEKAKESIQVCYKYFPDYNFVALDQNDNCVGAIFNLVNPYYDSDILFIVSVQVKPEFRKTGVGKALLQKAVDMATSRGLKGVRLLTDGRKEFPKSWYEKIGFKPTGYVEYSAMTEDIKL